MYAPVGWGKSYYLFQLYKEEKPKGNIFYIEETKETTLEEQIAALPNAERLTILISKLEWILESGKIHIIYQLLKERLGRDTFLISSTVPMPKEFYSLVLFYRVILYGIEQLRPSKETVRKYFLDREISLTDKELEKIEQDFQNQPLSLSLLELPLKKSKKGYCNLVREQCLEELYSYLDITFFRFLDIKEQSALLRLSCFERINEEKIAFVLKSSYKEAQDFIEHIIKKGSILERNENGLCFYPLFHQFLRHMQYKYLSTQELDDWYCQMIDYFHEHHSLKDALYFSYVLKKDEMMAEFMDKILQEEFGYKTFFSLEKYYLKLSPYYLELYPRLIFLASILESFYGNRSVFYSYQNLLYQKLEQSVSEEEVLLIQGLLLYQQIFATEGFDLEKLENILSEIHKNSALLSYCNWNFAPYHISILHGNKDYCKSISVKDLQKILEMNEVQDAVTQVFGDVIKDFLLFIMAEVYYEQNELDLAFEIVMKSWKEARTNKNIRMQQLCIANMIDVFLAKNQSEQIEKFQMRNLEMNMEEEDLLYTMHFRAFQVRYYLNINDKEQILHWLEEEAPDEKEHFYTTLYYVYLVKVRVYIWKEDYILAKVLLQMLRNFADEYKMYFLQIQVRMLDAVIYYREENSRWSKELEDALSMGKEIGFIRVFADEGTILYAPLQKFLEICKEEWEEDEYLKKVLVATRAQMMICPNYMLQDKQIDLSVFSGSEKNVMRFLVQGKKNSEIADLLGVSENTVKYHLKNIYQKLEVKNRSQAINRINEVKLL